jgi:hypothetical protein
MRSEQIESRFCWLWSFAIFVVLIAWGFWALFQVRLDDKGPDLIDQQKKRLAMSAFLGPIQDRANQLGQKYRGKQCFADLRAINLKDQELGYPRYDGTVGPNHVSDSAISMLMDKARRNENKLGLNGPLTYTPEFAREWEKHRQWSTKNLKPEEDKLAKKLSNLTFPKLLRWFAIFYLRSMLLALLLYPLLMLQRSKGVKKTVTENPMRAILAVPLWMIYVWSYPYNIFRELWLEAQIRRIGPLFRRLTEAERKTVCEVASLDKASYSRWIGTFEQRNRSIFARSAFIAMLGVVFLHIFCALLVLPASCSTSTREPVAISRAGPVTFEVSQDNSGNGGHTVVHEAILVADEPPGTHLIILWRLHEESVSERHRWDTIDHVPDLGWLNIQFYRIQSAGARLRQSNGGRNEKVRNNVNIPHSDRAVYVSSLGCKCSQQLC